MSEWTASEPVEVALTGRRWRSEIRNAYGDRIAFVYGLTPDSARDLAQMVIERTLPTPLTRAAVHRAVRDVLQSKQGQEYSHPSTKFSERIELLREICDWVADELLGRDKP